ncbi:hypothetical protein EV193_11727 [Herbihabitans rhizosphaerae]|uniref:Predicted DNA-binding protein ribbon-helix-helix domain-containing protein n=1 Tax=Herbihabitans rhizosphaerae TaxID=1872711 RepID=A0A4Q7KF92_9PSEU|nr:hypothetical protein [Herbihabitans rhizosphaerae]RZS30331.1 hypothetical protein EV193_11727 [Herbihabitans rhizosphaerae]
MPKRRMSISIEEELARRIKAAAEEIGVDVSTLMSGAAIDVVTRFERQKLIFADIDKRIAEVEAEADKMTDEEFFSSMHTLSDEQRNAIDARWDAFFKLTASA